MSNIQPIAVPATTGAMRSFGHTRLAIAGIDFFGGYENLKWTVDNDSENQYSNNPDPVGWSLGENKYTASVQLYYDWLMNLIQQLNTANGPGFQMQPFNAYFSYVGAGLVNYSDQLVGCKLGKIELSAQAGQGGKAITMPIDLKPIKIYPGGFDGNLYPLTTNIEV
jgi:hypothetical protein